MPDVANARDDGWTKRDRPNYRGRTNSSAQGNQREILVRFPTSRFRAGGMRAERLTLTLTISRVVTRVHRAFYSQGVRENFK